MTTNYEHYKDEMLNEFIYGCMCEFKKKHILGTCNCGKTKCLDCRDLFREWLDEEYKEPEIDWTNVAVDTPILVRDDKSVDWQKRYFAEYKKGCVYAWRYGCTSWSESGKVMWAHAKLAEDGD